MAFIAFDHVQLTMPAGSEAQAVAFFVGVLGMEHIPQPEWLRANGGAWFRAGTVELHLGIESDFRPVRKGHPGIVVDDLDVVAKRCEDAGYEVAWDTRYPQFRRFYIRDPFGNRMEIMQPVETEVAL
jgi:catechol 2,3-dioxygenase-like lactoylglutathione lyase family enzyme